MEAYLNLMKDVLENGTDLVNDRTGTGRRRLFGAQLRFSLKKGFPLVTSKQTFYKAAFKEMLWFLRGSNNILELHKEGVHIWDAWALKPDDDLTNDPAKVYTIGPMYGYVWRGHHGGRDQIKDLVNNLKSNPFGSRHCVTAWVPELLPRDDLLPHENVAEGLGALPPCHSFWQVFVDKTPEGNKRLSLQLYQRSADLPVGVPFNIAQYAMLAHLLAYHLDMDVGDFIWTGGDVHIYLNQIEQCQEQLKRDTHPLPMLKIDPFEDRKHIWDYQIDDFEIINYKHSGRLNYPVSV